MLIFSVFFFLLVWVHGSLVQSWIILTSAISASILSRNKMLGHKTWFFFQRGHVSNSDLFYFSFSFGIWSLEKKELEVNCAIVCNGKEIFLWKEKSIFMLAHPMSTYRLFNSNLWHMYDKKHSHHRQDFVMHVLIFGSGQCQTPLGLMPYFVIAQIWIFKSTRPETVAHEASFLLECLNGCRHSN